MNPDESSQISFEAMVSRIENLSRTQSTTPPNMPTIEQNYRTNRREFENELCVDSNLFIRHNGF